jgi:hypothetical protein
MSLVSFVLVSWGGVRLSPLGTSATVWPVAVSLYSSKTVDKKKILRTVSNTGIYCSSDKVGTVYLLLVPRNFSRAEG